MLFFAFWCGAADAQAQPGRYAPLPPITEERAEDSQRGGDSGAGTAESAPGGNAGSTESAPGGDAEPTRDVNVPRMPGRTPPRTAPSGSQAAPMPQPTPVVTPLPVLPNRRSGGATGAEGGAEQAGPGTDPAKDEPAQTEAALAVQASRAEDETARAALIRQWLKQTDPLASAAAEGVRVESALSRGKDRSEETETASALPPVDEFGVNPSGASGSLGNTGSAGLETEPAAAIDPVAAGAALSPDPWLDYIRLSPELPPREREKALQALLERPIPDTLRHVILKDIASDLAFQSRQTRFVRRYGFYANWFNRFTHTTSRVLQGNVQAVGQLFVDAAFDAFGSGDVSPSERRLADLIRELQNEGRASEEDRKRLAKLERRIAREQAEAEARRAEFALEQGDPDAALFYARGAVARQPDYKKAQKLEVEAAAAVAERTRRAVASLQVGYPDRNPPVDQNDPELLREVLLSGGGGFAASASAGADTGDNTATADADAGMTPGAAAERETGMAGASALPSAGEATEIDPQTNPAPETSSPETSETSRRPAPSPVRAGLVRRADNPAGGDASNGATSHPAARLGAATGPIARAQRASERVLIDAIELSERPDKSEVELMRAWAELVREAPPEAAGQTRWMKAALGDPQFNPDLRRARAQSSRRGRLARFIFAGPESDRERAYTFSSRLATAFDALGRVGIFYGFEVAYRAGLAAFSPPPPTGEMLDATAVFIESAPRGEERRDAADWLAEQYVKAGRFQSARTLLANEALLPAERERKLDQQEAKRLVAEAERLAADEPLRAAMLERAGEIGAGGVASRAKRELENPPTPDERAVVEVGWETFAALNEQTLPAWFPAQAEWFDGVDANGEIGDEAFRLESDPERDESVLIAFALVRGEQWDLVQEWVAYAAMPEEAQAWVRHHLAQHRRIREGIDRFGRPKIPYSVVGGAGAGGVDFYPKLRPIETEAFRVERYLDE